MLDINEAGLDFSINYPGLTIQEGDKYYFYSFVRQIPKKLPFTNSFDIILVEKKEDELDDSIVLAQSILDILLEHDVKKIHIEGYSYSSFGRFFIQLISYQTVLRHLLRINNIEIVIHSPTSIKKTAGKGNYKKEEMFQAFIQTKDEHLINNEFFKNVNIYNDVILLKKRTGEIKGVMKPFEDLIDSYFCLMTI